MKCEVLIKHRCNAKGIRRNSAIFSKIHSYRPLFQRFCPLG